MREYDNILFVSDNERSAIDIGNEKYMKYFVVRKRSSSRNRWLYYLPNESSATTKEEFKKHYNWYKQLKDILA